MKNTFGNSLCVTLFGESHGPLIGATLDGLAPGIPIKEDSIRLHLAKRAPHGVISTKRHEPDAFQIISGVKNGYSTGTPLTIIIPNTDIKSADYESNAGLLRPGHADYTAYCKYHGFQDGNGGGHFSGRITAALVAVGAVCMDALKEKHILIGTHIDTLSDIRDIPFTRYQEQITALEHSDFPVLSGQAAEKMRQKITDAQNACDSVGGITQTAVIGLPTGIGEPWFDTVEGVLSHALFSVPAVKGVEFGEGFGFALLTASRANDEMQMSENGILHQTNHNGGVIGGITNGMPLVFRCAVKPTPSIKRPQSTVNIATGQNECLELKGRHDPAIVHRVAEVISCVTAITLCDILCGRYGTDWLKKEE